MDELEELIRGLQPGQGIEIPSRFQRGDFLYRLRRDFPGYLWVRKEGHLFIMWPLGLRLPQVKLSRPREREEQATKLIEAGAVASVRELAGELGLTPEGTRLVLKRLGFALGSRKPKRKPPERVTITCPRCQRERKLMPSQAKARSSPYCGECWREIPAREKRNWRTPVAR